MAFLKSVYNCAPRVGPLSVTGSFERQELLSPGAPGVQCVSTGQAGCYPPLKYSSSRYQGICLEVSIGYKKDKNNFIKCNLNCWNLLQPFLMGFI